MINASYNSGNYVNCWIQTLYQGLLPYKGLSTIKEWNSDFSVIHRNVYFTNPQYTVT